MLRFILALLLALACSSCAAIMSADRFTPVEVLGSEPLGAADAGTLTTRDHLTPTGGMLLRFCGPDGVARIRVHDRPLDVVVRDSSTGLWAFGPLVPIIPTFGLGGDDPDHGLTIELLVQDDDGAFLGVDPRAVRLVPQGGTEAHQPAAASDWGYFREHAEELPPTGEALPLGPGSSVVLFFDVSFGELVDAGGFELELRLDAADGQVVTPRLRYELSSTWYLVLAG